jgi:hypothetical protein
MSFSIPSSLFAILQRCFVCLDNACGVVKARPQYLQVNLLFEMPVLSMMGSHGVLRALWIFNLQGKSNTLLHLVHVLSAIVARG